MNVLLDSTTLIDLLKGNPNAIETIVKLKETSHFFTTTINTYEILKGIHRSTKNRKEQFHAFSILLQSLDILQFDYNSSNEAASIYSELQRKGVTIDEEDYLIAGIARNNNIKRLITRNEKHFKSIEDLEVITY